MAVRGGEKLPTRILGKAGVLVPVLGFGTAAAGTRLSLAQAVRLYEEAFSQGVTYFDTAPEFAGYGKAQEQLGHFLQGRRKDVFLATKCFAADGDEALRILERSLHDLRTDYADLVFIHSLGDDKMNPQIVFNRRGIYPALLKAKTHGLTRFIGLSGHSRPGRFEEAIKHFEVDVLLNAVNFADRHTYNFEERVWPLAYGKNIGLVAMKVYGGQMSSARAGLSNCMMPRTLLNFAFRYSLSQPNVACAVIGMATSAELQENLDRAKSFTPLSKQETGFLHDAGKELAGQWGPHLGALV